MATGSLLIQANDGKIASVGFEDGASGNVNVSLPKEGGTLASKAYTLANSGATGGGVDKIFNLNDQVVTADYTIPMGKNAITAGDITIATGVTVTVSTGSKWSIV